MKKQDSDSTKLRPSRGSSVRAELDVLRSKVTELVEKSPDKAATILTEWVQKPALKPRSRKKIAG